MGRLKNGQAPTHRPHKSSGLGVVTLNGKDYYTGPWDTDTNTPTPEAEEKYNRLLSEWYAHGRCMPVKVASVLTVGGLLDRWVEFARGYYSKHGAPTSEFGLQEGVARDVRALYARLPATEFGPDQLRAVRTAWIRRGCCRRTCNHHTGRLVRVFRWAVNRKLVPSSAWTDLKAVEPLVAGRSATPGVEAAPDHKPVRAISEETLQTTLAHFRRDPSHFKECAQVQALTGMRPGEALRFRMRDTDRSGDVWKYTPTNPRTGKPDHKTVHLGHERVISIGPQAQAILSRVCEGLQPNEYPFHMTGDPTRPANRISYRNAIYRACRRAGIDEWHPHQIRHLFGTRTRAAHGADVTQSLLGHEKMATTERYAPPEETKGVDVIRLIG